MKTVNQVTGRCTKTEYTTNSDQETHLGHFVQRRLHACAIHAILVARRPNKQMSFKIKLTNY